MEILLESIYHAISLSEFPSVNKSLNVQLNRHERFRHKDEACPWRTWIRIKQARCITPTAEALNSISDVWLGEKNNLELGISIHEDGKVAAFN